MSCEKSEAQIEIDKTVDRIQWLFNVQRHSTPDLKPENVNKAFSSVEYMDVRIWGKDFFSDTIDQLSDGVFGRIWHFCDIYVHNEVKNGNILFETKSFGPMFLSNDNLYRHNHADHEADYLIIDKTIYGVFRLKVNE